MDTNELKPNKLNLALHLVKSHGPRHHMEEQGTVPFENIKLSSDVELEQFLVGDVLRQGLLEVLGKMRRLCCSPAKR